MDFQTALTLSGLSIVGVIGAWFGLIRRLMRRPRILAEFFIDTRSSVNRTLRVLLWNAERENALAQFLYGHRDAARECSIETCLFKVRETQARRPWQTRRVGDLPATIWKDKGVSLEVVSQRPARKGQREQGLRFRGDNYFEAADPPLEQNETYCFHLRLRASGVIILETSRLVQVGDTMNETNWVA